MNMKRCLKTAERMNVLLLHEFGQGVDGLRMVAEPLYARDVLLVCDAMPGTELAALAQQFRVAAAEKAQPMSAPPPPAAGGGRGSRQDKRSPSRGDTRTKTRGGHRRGAESADGTDTGAPGTSSFGTSIWSRIASGFGLTNPGSPCSPDSQPEAVSGRGQQPQRRWFSPSRWRAGK